MVENLKEKPDTPAFEEGCSQHTRFFFLQKLVFSELISNWTLWKIFQEKSEAL